jgi:hypothetical protein
LLQHPEAEPSPRSSAAPPPRQDFEPAMNSEPLDVAEDDLGRDKQQSDLLQHPRRALVAFSNAWPDGYKRVHYGDFLCLLLLLVRKSSI